MFAKLQCREVNITPGVNICQYLGNINRPADKLRAQCDIFGGLSRFTGRITLFSVREFNINPTVVEKFCFEIYLQTRLHNSSQILILKFSNR